MRSASPLFCLLGCLMLTGVASGQAPASSPLWSMSRLGEDAVLSAVAQDVSLVPPGTPAAAALAGMRRCRLLVKTAKATVEANASARFSGAEEAAQFQALLGTMQGLGLLDGINDTDLAAVARAARVGRDGHDVTLALALPANTAARLAAHAGPAAQ